MEFSTRREYEKYAKKPKANDSSGKELSLYEQLIQNYARNLDEESKEFFLKLMENDNLEQEYQKMVKKFAKSQSPVVKKKLNIISGWKTCLNQTKRELDQQEKNKYYDNKITIKNNDLLADWQKPISPSQGHKRKGGTPGAG